MTPRNSSEPVPKNGTAVSSSATGESDPDMRIFRRLLSRWLEVFIPFGYQDETGFHFGIQPARTRIPYSEPW